MPEAPRPLSRIVNVNVLPRSRTLMRTAPACACRATLVSASCRIRNIASWRVRSAGSSFSSARQPAADARPRLELRRFPLNRFLQAEMIEHRRPQIARNLADRLDAHLDQPDQRLQLVDELNARLRLAVAELIDQPHELELQARQHLAELVVQLSGDSRALFLARQLQSKREGCKPVAARVDGRAAAPPAWRRRSRHRPSAVLLVTK